ncbi:TPA: hypothetical protein PPE16_004355 [Escherichia coli]|nr:hypothetical protein [Escherichia coli]
MNKCRKTPKNARCAPEPVEAVPPLCDPFSVCLSFGRTLSYDGACVRLNGQPVIPDGWYGEVHVVNGCIVDAREAPVPLYTPPPCAPAATPCGEGGGEGGVTLSPDAANLSRLIGNQLMTKLYLGQNEGVTVTGDGTQNNPLTIRLAAGDGDGIFMTSGSPDALTISGSGEQADPFILKLTNSPLGAGTFGALELDSLGRVVGYNEDAGGDALRQLIDGNGTKGVSVGPGVGRIDLEEVEGVKGSYTMGGYSLSVDDTGRVEGVKRGITLTAGTYTLGNYSVTINAYGSITKLEKVTVPAEPNVFVAQYAAGEPSQAAVMSFTTEVPGRLHIEYIGYLGTATAQTPGLAENVTGTAISVDGSDVPRVLTTLMPSGTPGTMVSTGVRGITPGIIPAGPHTVAVRGPDIMGQHAAILKCTVVGVGT